MIVKCYDRFGRLWVSKPIAKNSNQFSQILADARNTLGAEVIFCKEGKTSHRINLNNQEKKVFGCYTGSDGVKTWTIPTRPSAYPLISHPHGDKNNTSAPSAKR